MVPKDPALGDCSGLYVIFVYTSVVNKCANKMLKETRRVTLSGLLVREQGSGTGCIGMQLPFSLSLMPAAESPKLLHVEGCFEEREQLKAAGRASLRHCAPVTVVSRTHALAGANNSRCEAAWKDRPFCTAYPCKKREGSTR